MGPRQHEKACQDVACLSFNIADSAQADLEFLQVQTDLLSDIFNLANGDRPERWMMEGVPGGGQGGSQRDYVSPPKPNRSVTTEVMGTVKVTAGRDHNAHLKECRLMARFVLPMIRFVFTLLQHAGMKKSQLHL